MDLQEKTTITENTENKEPVLVAPVAEEQLFNEEQKLNNDEEKESQSCEMYDDSFVSLKIGQFLNGKVVNIDKDGILVDIGYKSEGIVPKEELSFKNFSDPAEVVSLGEMIDVVVLNVDDSEGFPILSKKRADTESTWRKIVQAFNNNEIFTATVVDSVKGGLIVDLGIRGFIPKTHIDIRPIRDLSDYIGEELRLKIIELDKDRRKVVLSSKIVKEQEQKQLADETIDSIYEGQVRTGRIARLTDFGAFIDLGGLDGLVHISEISQQRRINHPSDVLRAGDNVEVLVLKVDKQTKRISLSIKQALPDPWLEVDKKFKSGQTVKGTISKLANKYAFIELEPGIEGVVPMYEIEENKVSRPDETINVGQHIQVKIIDVKPTERRILLSLRQVREEEYRQEYNQYFHKESEGSFNIGNLLREKMKGSETQNPK